MVHPLSSLLTPRGGTFGTSQNGSPRGGVSGRGLFGGGWTDKGSLDDASGAGVGVSVGGEGTSVVVARGLSSGYIRYYRWDTETHRRVPVSLFDDDALVEEVLGSGLGLEAGQGSEQGSRQGSELALVSGLGSGLGSGRSVVTGRGSQGQGHGHSTLRLLAVFEPHHRDWR